MARPSWHLTIKEKRDQYTQALAPARKFTIAAFWPSKKGNGCTGKPERGWSPAQGPARPALVALVFEYPDGTRETIEDLDKFWWNLNPPYDPLARHDAELAEKYGDDHSPKKDSNDDIPF